MTFNEESKVSTSRNNHVTLKAIIHVKFSLRHGIVLDGLFSWNPSCSYKPSGTRKLVMSNDLASSPPWVLLGEAILSRICWYLLPSFQTLWLNSDLICQCLIKIGEALTLLYQYTHIPHTRDLYLSVPRQAQTLYNNLLFPAETLSELDISFFKYTCIYMIASAEFVGRLAWFVFYALSLNCSLRGLEGSFQYIHFYQEY